MSWVKNYRLSLTWPVPTRILLLRMEWSGSTSNMQSAAESCRPSHRCCWKRRRATGFAKPQYRKWRSRVEVRITSQEPGTSGAGWNWGPVLGTGVWDVWDATSTTAGKERLKNGKSSGVADSTTTTEDLSLSVVSLRRHSQGTRGRVHCPHGIGREAFTNEPGSGRSRSEVGFMSQRRMGISPDWNCHKSLHLSLRLVLTFWIKFRHVTIIYFSKCWFSSLITEIHLPILSTRQLVTLFAF